MAQDSIQRTGASMGRSPANCTVLVAIREEEPVIRLYYLDQWLANVEILDGGCESRVAAKLIGWRRLKICAGSSLRRMAHSYPTLNCTTLCRTSFAVTCGPITWISC
jgi:hypothetical protein